MHERKIKVIRDKNDRQVVLINDIIFKGRQHIEWNNVENYIKKYIGNFIEIADSRDIVYIGKDLPDEYCGSKYTASLKGTLAKAKANAVQGIPELIEIAGNRQYQKNMNIKHNNDAKFGWYRYTSRFALPVYNALGNVERYNVFSVVLVVRHARDGKMYLYDMINIKKETGTPL